jgi:hypothetical protein
MTERQPKKQSASAGNDSVIIQAGHDVNLPIVRTPPDIRLVRIEVEEVDHRGARVPALVGGLPVRPRINVVVKNNGGTTAVLLSGHLVAEGRAIFRDCRDLNTQLRVIEADWTYEVDIDDESPRFVGRHAIEPNEVVSFNVEVGRRSGGQAISIYRAHICLVFDEGEELETGPFYLRLIGPTVEQGSVEFRGPTRAQWAACMTENIRQLDAIGYDLRPRIRAEENGVPYIEAAAPGLLSQSPKMTPASGNPL